MLQRMTAGHMGQGRDRKPGGDSGENHCDSTREIGFTEAVGRLGGKPSGSD